MIIERERESERYEFNEEIPATFPVFIVDGKYFTPSTTSDDDKMLRL